MSNMMTHAEGTSVPEDGRVLKSPRPFDLRGRRKKILLLLAEKPLCLSELYQIFPARESRSTIRGVLFALKKYQLIAKDSLGLFRLCEKGEQFCEVLTAERQVLRQRLSVAQLDDGSINSPLSLEHTPEHPLFHHKIETRQQDQARLTTRLTSLGTGTVWNSFESFDSVLNRPEEANNIEHPDNRTIKEKEFLNQASEEEMILSSPAIADDRGGGKGKGKFIPFVAFSVQESIVVSGFSARLSQLELTSEERKIITKLFWDCVLAKGRLFRRVRNRIDAAALFELTTDQFDAAINELEIKEIAYLWEKGRQKVGFYKDWIESLARS